MLGGLVFLVLTFHEEFLYGGPESINVGGTAVRGDVSKIIWRGHPTP